MAKCNCCGCVIADDYGTSTVTGIGSNDDPYQITPTDTSFVRPMVRAIQDTQTISNASQTAITYDNTVFDTDSMWAGGNPSRITFNTAGLYLFGSRWRWDANATGLRNSYWYHTSSMGQTLLIDTHRAPGSLGMYMNAPYQWHFDVGDYIELFLEQTSGGNLAATVIATYAVWIGNF